MNRGSVSRAAMLRSLLALAVAACALLRPAVTRSDEAATLVALRQEKLAAAKEWHEASLLAFAAGTARCTPLHESSLAWKEAEYELARDKSARLKALRGHAERMTALYDKYNSIILEIPFRDSLAMLHFWSLEAKVSLAEEIAK